MICWFCVLKICFINSNKSQDLNFFETNTCNVKINSLVKVIKKINLNVTATLLNINIDSN